MSEANTTPDRTAPKGELETSFAGRTISVGDIVSGEVVKITGNVAFVNYGARSEGYIELGELKNDDGILSIEVGSQVEAEVIGTRGAVQLSAKRAHANRVINELRTAWKKEQVVEGKVVGTNKGGLEVRVQGLRAFCPTSQIAQRPTSDTLKFVGQVLQFRITEFAKDKSLVVSHRAVLDAKAREMRSNMGELVQVGDIKQGRVTQVKDFGAFVDIGDGLEGLIHVSEISHDHVKHPREHLTVNDAIVVKVIRIEQEKGRVGLSIKAMEANPWDDFVANVKVGDKLSGPVQRIQPFGAFVQLAPGIDGLLHVSAITTSRRIESPAEMLKVGEEVEVIVEKIERDRKRIGLMTPEVAERRKPMEITVKAGDVVKGKVNGVMDFGVFLEIEPNVKGLIPNGEMDTPRDSDHKRMFPDGTELEVKVLEVDRKRGRIRLSRKALKFHAEEMAMKDYRDQQKDAGGQKMGTFGDMFKDFFNK